MSAERVPHAIPAERGAVLGATNAVCIALLYALDGHSSDHYRCGLLECPNFVYTRESATSIWLAVVMHVLPISIALGMLIGCIAKELERGWFVQLLTCVALAITISLFAVIPWPSLLPMAWASGTVHAVVLVVWMHRGRRS